jgi:hypothetical protein
MKNTEAVRMPEAPFTSATRRHLSFLAFGVLLLASAPSLSGNPASGAPESPDHTALIARMREAALTYLDRLQDFVCTQITTRSVDTSGTGKQWKLLEVQELDLNYVGHRENYVLLKVNGQSQDAEKRIKGGFYRPGGEFGSALGQIFEPKVNAEFTWDHEETAAGAPLCVFQYRVSQATSKWGMRYDADVVTFAHHGFVYANCDNGSVMRIQMESEPATIARKWYFKTHQLPVGQQLDVRYGPTTIGTKEFLVPEFVEEINRFGPHLTKVEIQFQKYRKFEANSKILLDQEEQKPETAPQPQR